MDQEELRDLMREFCDSPLSLLEVEYEGVRVKMMKPVAGQPAGDSAASSMSLAAKGAEISESLEKGDSQPQTGNASAGVDYLRVTAPLVGVYYSASAPGEKPYVSLGNHVDVGDVLCLIEAMKMINEIKATEAGTVRFIAPRNGETVGFGDLLMEIEADE